MNQLQRVLDALEDAGYHGSVIAIVKQMMQAEPVAYESRMYPEKTTARNTWSPCTKEQHDMYIRSPEFQGWIYEARALFAEPQAVPVRKPLTHEQIQSAYTRAYNGGDHGRDFENAFCREIEKVHGIV
jgi:hypothetical protein